MTFQLLLAIAAALWLASLALSAVAVFAKRFSTSLILSVCGLVIGYLGLSRVRISASKTVNGQVQWSFDSKWFFIATVVLAALALGYTLWKKLKKNGAPSPT
jgi:hypothetical protein